MAYKPQQVKLKGGFYSQTKVYSDGSHYIAIPHTERPYRPRRKPVEEVITVNANAPPIAEKVADVQLDSECELNEQGNSAPAEEADALMGVIEENNSTPPNMPKSSEIKITKKQLFEKLYKENLFLKRRERREKIIKAMRTYFDSDERAELYVDANLDRKQRNLIARRIRLTRKANLQNFNYFVTVKYIYGYAPGQLSR